MSVVPASIARLPWKLMLLIAAIAIFGAVVLYSAAGGSITPWALNQLVRFVIFSGMALVLSAYRSAFSRASPFQAMPPF